MFLQKAVSMRHGVHTTFLEMNPQNKNSKRVCVLSNATYE
jgi:hypothetical protein